MTNYADMSKAARDSQSLFNSFRGRAYGYLDKILQGLSTHCQVPHDKITFLKLVDEQDGNRTFSPADPGRRYSLSGATVFDDSDGYWNLGIRISLTQLQFITFVLCVTEEGGIVKVKTGRNAKPRVLNLDSEGDINAFCDSIADGVVAVFAEPRSSNSRTLGFGPAL